MVASMPVPANEVERLIALRNCHILDTPPSPAYDDLTYLAAEICAATAASFSLLDEKRQWFKSMFGYPLSETPREVALCNHTIMGTSQLVVSDLTKDERFAHNPFVTNAPHVRFYCGTPVMTTDGFPVGSLCVYDLVPRELTLEQTIALGVISRQVACQIELGRRIVDQECLVQQLEQLNASLGSLANMDALTGLHNRRAFDDNLNAEWARSLRHNSPMSLIMFDVDHFKQYNDTYGHIYGDKVLRKIGYVMSKVSRGTDLTARYGGEEFAIILPQTCAESAAVVAERLRSAIAYADWYERPVTASFGVATTCLSMTTPEELIARADQALYRSKSDGRNRVTRIVD